MKRGREPSFRGRTCDVADALRGFFGSPLGVKP